MYKYYKLTLDCFFNIPVQMSRIFFFFSLAKYGAALYLELPFN